MKNWTQVLEVMRRFDGCNSTGYIQSGGQREVCEVIANYRSKVSALNASMAIQQIGGWRTELTENYNGTWELAAW